MATHPQTEVTVARKAALKVTQEVVRMIPVCDIGAGREYGIRRRVSGERSLAVEKDRNPSARTGAADEARVCVEIGHDHRHMAITNALFPREKQNRFRERIRLGSAIARAE